MLRFFILFFIFTSFRQIYGQEKNPFPINLDTMEMKKRVAMKDNKHWDILPEKLEVNDKLYSFQYSPIIYRENYIHLFSKHPAITFLIKKEKPLTAKWIIKNDCLYLSDFTYLTFDTDPVIDEKGNLIEEKPLPIPSKEELYVELEDFLQSKRDKDGHIKATWLTGKVGLYTGKKGFYSVDESYINIHLKKGKILKIEETDNRWKPLKK